MRSDTAGPTLSGPSLIYAAIDTLKATVPIWKKEWYEDGSVWLEDQPVERQ